MDFLLVEDEELRVLCLYVGVGNRQRGLLRGREAESAAADEREKVLPDIAAPSQRR